MQIGIKSGGRTDCRVGRVDPKDCASRLVILIEGTQAGSLIGTGEDKEGDLRGKHTQSTLLVCVCGWRGQGDVLDTQRT